MSLLTELYVAPDDRKASEGPEAAGAGDRLELGGLTNLEFETLWAILAQVPWDSKRHALREIAGSDDSWIFRFPDEYVAILAGTGQEQTDAATVEWAQTEEINSSPDEVRPAIAGLTALARRATEGDLALYLRSSL